VSHRTEARGGYGVRELLIVESSTEQSRFVAIWVKLRCRNEWVA